MTGALAVARHSLTDARAPLLWWCSGLALYVAMNLAFYPLLRDDPSLSALMEGLPESLRTLIGSDLNSPAGYVSGQILSTAPLLLSVFAGLWGAGLIAGAEARGRLEHVLALPLPRTGLLLGRALALLTMLAALWLALALSIWAFGAAFGAALEPGAVFAATARHVAGAWLFGALALALGAAFGRAGLASGVAIALALALVVLHSLGGSVTALEGLRAVNPWSYALDPAALREPLSPWPAVAFLGVGGLLLILAAPRWNGRDVGG